MAPLPAGKHHREPAERGPDLLCQKTLPIEERQGPPSVREPPFACIVTLATLTEPLCCAPVLGPQATITHCMGPCPACFLPLHTLSPLTLTHPSLRHVQET